MQWWMPDLAMFCPIFSWLKHFKIPPAKILQSRVLDSKVRNAFSAPSFALRDALLCSVLLNNSLYISPWNILIQKFFIIACIVFNKKSSMMALTLNFVFFFFLQFTFYKDKIQYGDKQLVLPSLFVQWKLIHSRFAFVDINVAQHCQ